MTREEALFKLDEAIRNKLFHHSTRGEYESLCNTSKGREEFEKILNVSQQQERKAQERKARKALRAAQKVASRGKGGVA